MLGKLLLLFISLPLVELWLFMSLGQRLGLPTTLAAIVITGFLGATLTKRQGGNTLRSLRSTLQSGQLPHRDALEGVLILLAGAVLLTPGFVSDAVGFALLIPMVRARVGSYLLQRLIFKVKQKRPPAFDKSRTFTTDENNDAASSTPPAEPSSLRPVRGRVVE